MYHARRCRSRSGQFFSGLIVITLGLMFLLDSTGLLQFDIWQYWPVVMILVGVRMVAAHLIPHDKETDHA